MDVLIVESDENLGRLWQRHIERQGNSVVRIGNGDAAVEYLSDHEVSVVILDLGLADGSPLVVADFVTFRWPQTKIIVVTSTSFFSDGSVFGLSPSVCAYLPARTPPEDLTAMIEHYGRSKND
ncbi:response regulator [Poseidonocella sedimentorum]|uniref:Response regulator receiver domain-containing protein n=1 Tax=Poseidonocella sedimentorum TaxID=871652 RepID=A0A1I6E0X4_9RHOB|nr:response regulator [Poseidonocella sedimentorum]SFR11346.1 Response regulator receiver domain-containing protein [Poseidonocella sedimentorum]